MAAALVSYARIHGVEPSDNVTDFEIIPGEGVSGVVDGHTIQIGNTRMANRLGWDTGIPLFVMQIFRFSSVFVSSIVAILKP